MHGAGTAQRHAAAEFRAGHAEHVSQHPEQRCITVDIDAARTSIDIDGKGHVPSPSVGPTRRDDRGVLSFTKRFRPSYSNQVEGDFDQAGDCSACLEKATTLTAMQLELPAYLAGC